MRAHDITTGLLFAMLAACGTASPEGLYGEEAGVGPTAARATPFSDGDDNGGGTGGSNSQPPPGGTAGSSIDASAPDEVGADAGPCDDEDDDRHKGKGKGKGREHGDC